MCFGGISVSQTHLVFFFFTALIAVNSTLPNWEDLTKTNYNLQPGGWYRPPTCQAKHKIAIIIPYRDREEHLKLFLQHMHPYLQAQRLEYTIYVVELVSDLILIQPLACEMYVLLLTLYNAIPTLTHYQRKNFRLFQTERVCRRQFHIWWKWQKVIQSGRKHCGKRRNCSLWAISPFPTVFSKGLFPRGVQRCLCVGMG